MGRRFDSCPWPIAAQFESLETRHLLAADMVLQWNDVLLDDIRIDKTAPPTAARAMAIVQTAVFDAVNTIDQRLIEVNVGKSAAAAILAARLHDGVDAIVEYTPGTTPGDWQPTPPVFVSPLLPQWPDVDPWTMSDAHKFRPQARAGRVFRLLSRLRKQGSIDDEHKSTTRGFHLPHCRSQRFIEVVFLPARACQKTSQLATMDRFGSNHGGGRRTRHSPAMLHEGQCFTIPVYKSDFKERNFKTRERGIYLITGETFIRNPSLTLRVGAVANAQLQN